MSSRAIHTQAGETPETATHERSWKRDVLVTAGLVALATLARLAVAPWIGSAHPFLFYYLALIAAASLSGRNSALLATFLGLLLGEAFFVDPSARFQLDVAAQASATRFLLIGLMVVLFTGRLHAAHEAASRQKQWLDVTLGSIGDGVIATDAQGRVSYMNAVAETLTGLSAADSIGKPFNEVFRIIHETTRAPAIDPVRQVLDTGQVATLANHTLLIHADGTEQPIEDSAAPIRDSQGRIHGVVLVFRVVSQLVRAEREAQIWRNRYEAAVQLSGHILTTSIPTTTRSWSLATPTEFWESLPSRSPAHSTSGPTMCIPMTGPSISKPPACPAKPAPHSRPNTGCYATMDRPSSFATTATSSPATTAGPTASSASLRTSRKPRARPVKSIKVTGVFRKLAETMPQIAFIVENNGQIAYINSRWSEYTGLNATPGQINSYLTHVLHPDDFQTLIEVGTVAFHSGQPLEAQVRLRRGADGAYRWFLVRCIPLRDADGQIVEWVGTSTDIDSQKRAEQSVRDRERLYRAIGESIDYGVWICDPDGRNTYASDSLLRLIGYSQAECSEFGWGKALHPDDAERTLSAWKECVRTLGTWDIEHRFLGVDGEYHPCLARGVPVRDDNGRVLCWAGINLDISRMKAAEDALRVADQRKDHFLATLAHELRNPLAPIRNSLSYLKLACPDNPGLQQARDIIDRQVKQMARLLDDLLDSSRISRNRLDLQKEIVTFRSIVDQAVETSRPLIDAREQTLCVSLPGGDPRVDADPTRLAQVFSNLLTNSAKYTHEGGHIRFLTAIEQGLVVTRIQDDGIGIAPEQLPQIFDLFSQASPASRHGGLGIGLALVRSLVELHGGTVEAQSDGLGCGSLFIVRLPILVDDPARSATAEPSPSEAIDVSPEPPGAESVPPSPPNGRHTEGRAVLVVDDNRDAADSLARFLQGNGVEVSIAYDGHEAIEVAERIRPRAILMDLGMPRLDGYQAAQILRGLPWAHSTLLVAVSGWGQGTDRDRSREAGFDLHLVKPVNPLEVLELLGASAPSRSLAPPRA